MRHHVAGPGRGSPAGLVRWPWRVARTIRDGGPSRVVPMRQPRITGYGGRSVCCVIRRAHRSTPKAVGRVSFGAHSARSPERSAQRGSCGASLKHRARDAGGTGGLAALPAKSRQHRAERPNRPARDRAALVPRGIEARGFKGPRRSARPQFFRRNGISLRTTGEPGARSNNTGGEALACDDEHSIVMPAQGAGGHPVARTAQYQLDLVRKTGFRLSLRSADDGAACRAATAPCRD